LVCENKEGVHIILHFSWHASLQEKEASGIRAVNKLAVNNVYLQKHKISSKVGF